MEVWRHLEREVDGVKLKRAVAALLHSPGSREHDRQQVRTLEIIILKKQTNLKSQKNVNHGTS